ncbi:MAG: 2-oxoacid:ferredoxin oxidoreductase subunit beta [Desulfobulbaceae bacterium]|nr:2-oxoacid:ferredoxin oxidoreductase subunit beta [Desulfobulbaceae bacterium]
MADEKDYTGQTPAWCPGCGNFSLLATLKKTLAAMDIPPHELIVVSGIGQAAKLPHYLRCNAFNGLHGRALPVATGISMVNPDMKLLVTTGDGDCYGEGGNHFLHAMRRNVNMALFVHNNQIYGLTKGQASPTSRQGMKSKTQPFGSLSSQFNPLSMAISQDCGFVARGFIGDREHLQHLMTEAINHRGFSLVDIFQPCVSFNKVNTFKWYKERVYHLEEEHDAGDRMKAFQRSLEWGEKIPVGIFYRHDNNRVLTDDLPPLKNGPLPLQDFDPQETTQILEEFY